MWAVTVVRVDTERERDSLVRSEACAEREVPMPFNIDDVEVSEEAYNLYWGRGMTSSRRRTYGMSVFSRRR
jgi:hypothetical protein